MKHKKYIKIYFFLIALLVGINFESYSQTACIQASVVEVCIDAPSVNFNSCSLGALSFCWDFGDGIGSSVQQNPSYSYLIAGPGIYNVVLTACDASGCSGSCDTDTLEIIVHALPTAVFTASDTVVCSSEEVCFYNQSLLGDTAIQSVIWNLGGTVSNVQDSACHNYSIAGDYDISLQVVDYHGCSNTLYLSDYVSVNQPPTADFVTSTGQGTNPIHVGCNDSNKSVTFTDSSTSSNTINSWSWDFDNGVLATSNTVSLNFSEGNYDVTLAITDGSGCIDSVTKTIQVENYQAGFTSPGISGNAVYGCEGLAVTFTDTTATLNNVISWQWDFDYDGTIFVEDATGSTVSHTYLYNGAYDVALVTTNDYGCVDTTFTSAFVEIYPPPNVGFIADTTVNCETPFTVTFTDTTQGVVSWIWDIDNWDDISTPSTYDWSQDYTDSSFSHTYNDIGCFNVSLISTDTNGCTDSLINHSFICIDKPFADFVADTTMDISNIFVGSYITKGCIPLKVHFKDISIYTGSLFPDSIVSWYWDFGDGYTIVGGNNSILDGTNDSLTSCTYTNPTHIYVDTGVFEVTLVVTTAHGCSDTIIMGETNMCQNLGGPCMVEAGLPLNVDFTVNDTVGCHPFAVDFQDLSSSYANGWNWDFGDGSTSTHQNPQYTYQQDIGYFDVSLFSFYNGCKSETLLKDSMILVEEPRPDFTVHPFIIDQYTNNSYACFDDPLCIGGWKIEIRDLSKGASGWVWDFGDTSTVKSIDTLNITGDVMHWIEMQMDTQIINIDTTTYTYTYNIVPVPDTIIDTLYTIYLPELYDTTFQDTLSIGCNTQFIEPFSVDSVNASSTITPYATDTLYYIPHDLVTFDTTISLLYSDTIIFTSSNTITSSNPNQIVIGQDTINVTWTYLNVDTFSCNISADTNFIGIDIVLPDTVMPDTISDTTFVNADTILSGLCDTLFIAADTIIDPPDIFINDTLYKAKYFSHTYNTPGTKRIWLYTWKYCSTCPDSLCIDSTSRDIYISKIDAEFTTNQLSGGDTAGCGPFLAVFNDVSTTVYDSIQRIWDFGDGSSIITSPYYPFLDTPIPFETHQTPMFPDGATSGTYRQVEHYYETPGTYTVQMTIIDSNNCMDIATHQVVVYENPIPGFIADTSAGCVQDSLKNILEVTFTDTNTYTSRILNWIWNYGDNSPIDTTYIPMTQSHPYTLCDDTADVDLSVIDENGCQGGPVSSVSIKTYCPFATFTPISDTICNGESITFYPSGSSGGQNISPLVFYWDWCDTSQIPLVDTTFSMTSIDHAFNVDTTRIFNVSLTVENDFGCRDDTTISIVVEKVISDFSFQVVDIDTICPQFFQFTGTSTPPANQWIWDFDDGNSAFINPATNTYTLPGEYDVSLISTTSFGCTDTLLKENYVAVKGPIIIDTLIIDTGTCIPYPVTFSATAFNADVFTWYFEDGNDTTFVVGADPFNPDTTTITFVYYYTQGGTFQPVLELKDPADSAGQRCPYSYALDSITVPEPQLDFFTDDTICGSRAVSFYDTSIGVQDIDVFFWDFGDGNTIQGFGNIPVGTNNNLTSGTYNEPIHYYENSGIYDVTFGGEIQGNDSCIYQITKTEYIIVFDMPLSYLSGCPPLTVTFDASSINIDTSNLSFDLNSIIWFFGDGDTAMGYSVTHTYTGDSVNTYYNVSAQFTQNCIFNYDSLVTVYSVPTANSTVNSHVTCNGLTNGVAAASATMGTGTYVYTWSSGQVGDVQAGLGAGSYIVTVTDNNGCFDTTSLIVTQPDSLLAIVNSVDLLCNGLCQGQANSIVYGGTAPYQYQWDDPDSQTTLSATGLCSGTYNVTVTDTNNCITMAQVMVSEPTVLSLMSNSNDISCVGICDGFVAVAPSGGVGPYGYLWDDPLNQTSDTAIGLCPGIVCVTVIDSNSCSFQSCFTINDAVSLNTTTNTTDALCYGDCSGLASVNTTGGLGPYTYLWNDPSNQTNSLAIDLCAGNYFVTVSDSNNCEIITNISIFEPDTMILLLSQTPVDCNGNSTGGANLSITGGIPGYSYFWSNGSTSQNIDNVLVGIYFVTISDSNLCTTVAQVEITQPDSLLLTTTTIESYCSLNNGQVCVDVIGGIQPYQYLWNDPIVQTSICAMDLSPGSYNVTVTDSNGCEEYSQASITETSLIESEISGENILCNNAFDGTASVVNVTGGEPPYVYVWSNGENTDNIVNLGPGNYIVTVTDQNNCDFKYLSIDLTEPDPLKVLIFEDCEDGFGILYTKTTGGNPPYEYNWSNGETESYIYDAGIDLYIVSVIDSNNCGPVYDTIDYVPCKVIIPNSFTPNGNGENDVWEIENLKYANDCFVNIYNRWGDIVYTSTGYEFPWDGTSMFTNKSLPSAVYYYVIENLDTKYVKTGKLTGSVTIVR